MYFSFIFNIVGWIHRRCRNKTSHWRVWSGKNTRQPHSKWQHRVFRSVAWLWQVCNLLFATFRPLIQNIYILYRSESTWEPSEHLNGSCKNLLTEFKSRQSLLRSESFESASTSSRQASTPVSVTETYKGAQIKGQPPVYSFLPLFYDEDEDDYNDDDEVQIISPPYWRTLAYMYKIRHLKHFACMLKWSHYHRFEYSRLNSNSKLRSLKTFFFYITLSFFLFYQF